MRPGGSERSAKRSSLTAAAVAAERHLSEMEGRYRGLLEAAPDAMVVVNNAGKIVLLNLQAEKQFGYRRDELLGQRVTAIIPDGFAERLVADGQRAAAEALAQQIGTGLELTAIRKDGTAFPIELMLSPMTSPEGVLVTAAIRDISVRREADHRLAEMESRCRGLLEAAPDAMVVVNERGEIVFLNIQAEYQFGYRRDELLGQPVTNLIRQGFAERLVADGTCTADCPLVQQMGTGIELTGYRKDGTEFPIEIMLSPLDSAEGVLVTAAIRNISARKAADKSEAAKGRSTIAKIEKSILLVEDNSGDARILREMLNEQRGVVIELAHVETMRDFEGHVAANAVDIILLDLGLPDTEGLEAVRRARKAAPNTALVVITGLDDETMAVQALQEGAQDYLVKGSIDTRELLRVLRNAFERNVMETAAVAMTEHLTHSAEHDFLTGLPNRMLLNDRIGQAIALAPRHLNSVALLFLDLDHFKHINDSFGHSTGDKLLQSVSARLKECVRVSDTVSRQGGDEFVVLLSEVEQAEDAAITARRMLKSVAEAHSIDAHELHITASIGISVYPDDGLDAETLVKNADTAMYQAKANERQGFQFFTPTMHFQAVERQSIEECLRRALERNELALHYQPQVDLKTGAIIGAEALLRWTHPVLGAVSPAILIPVAEECGLILQIGAWVLREACVQAQAWVKAGRCPVSMAVNISALEFRDERFLSGLFSILEETGFDPRLLQLELTESVLMKRTESAALLLHAIRARGVRVAVDDFGTGYSSLSYLRKFPVDALKIDQSFVSQISASGNDATLVTAVIAMARSLNLRVIAEGVESEEQRNFLRGQNCDEAQGHYFSRPIPASQFARLLAAAIPQHDAGGSQSLAVA